MKIVLDAPFLLKRKISSFPNGLTVCYVLGQIIKATNASQYDIVINEVADNGSSGMCNEKPWVELHNKGTIDINLIGMSLKRDGGYNLKKFTFGSLVMMAGEYRVICNPNPRVGSGPPGPPGFTSQILSDTEGKEVSNTGYFMHPFGDITWSLLADGTYADSAATPGAINYLQEYSLVINEVADGGSSGMCNEGQLFGVRWVELYNKGTTNINLIGMTLECDDGYRKKFTFGSLVMMAGEYYVICNPNPRNPGPPGPPGFIRQILLDPDGKEVSNTGYFMCGKKSGDITWSLLADGTYADGAATPGSINRCQENPLDTFYLSETKKFRTCKWLSNLKNVSKQHICKRKVDWMNKIGPAEVVCQETCKSCAVCYQQNRSQFYYKNKLGQQKYSTCGKLEDKWRKEEICKSIIFDETYGIPNSLFACPQTCLIKHEGTGQELC